MTEINIEEVKHAIEQMSDSEKICKGYTERAFKRAGGLEAFIKTEIRNVGDLRMIMNDELDKLVADKSADEEIRFV